MRIGVRCRRVEDPAGVRAHAEKRLGFALSRFRDAVGEADVSLDDENGPRGGPAIRCVIRVAGTRGWEVVVSDEAADPLEAVDRAAGRLGRAVAREMEKRRGFDARREGVER